MVTSGTPTPTSNTTTQTSPLTFSGTILPGMQSMISSIVNASISALIPQIGTVIQQQVDAAVSKAMTTPALAQGMWRYIYIVCKLYGAFKPGHQRVHWQLACIIHS